MKWNPNYTYDGGLKSSSLAYNQFETYFFKIHSNIVHLSTPRPS